MSEPQDRPPESDRLEGTPHPRETQRLIGHARTEADLLAGYRSGRLPHAIILGGEPGIGKATLAWRLARFILAHPDPAATAVHAARDLSVDPEHPVARQVLRLAHPDVAVLRRGPSADRKSFAQEIKVDDVRRLQALFATTAGAGGWRIAIVDAADDLNTASANALLKLIEEPPPRSLILLVAEQPKRLLPTIRSRCRMIQLAPLSDAEVGEVLGGLGELTDGIDAATIARAAALSGGSVLRAARLLDEDRLALHTAITEVLDELPKVEPRRAHRLADVVAGRDGGEAFATFAELALDRLHAVLHEGAEGPLGRLATVAETWEKIARAARDADAFNLDRRPLVLSILDDLAAALRR